MASKPTYVHPTAGHARRKPPSPYAIEPIVAFYIFMTAGLVSALFAPIQDCDETFNYWEPAHYLSHGYGLQTWEYSPDYALRSWTYIALHAVVANFRRLLPRSTKVAEFYFVRYALAMLCAVCQTWLWRVISLTLNSRVAMLFLVATVISPGNFHASTAFLPSSFAMCMAMLGAAAFMNWRGGMRTSQGIFWFALGGVLGWPFAAALCVPLLVEELLAEYLGDMTVKTESWFRLFRGVVAGAIVIALDASINMFFYRKLHIVSWNIVKYNIFSSLGGPDLYGTEPWTFYFKNLALNFNIWFILALLALPLFLIQKLLLSPHSFQASMRTTIFLFPFYMWLFIFTIQPHKEERFMYPAYPFLAFNAAVSANILLAAIGNADPKTLVGKIPAKLKLLAVGLVFVLSVDVSLSRIYGVASAYSAPLRLYEPLGTGVAGEKGIGRKGDNICFGKDWYRLPTSYFLPRGMHAKWVRSEFHGLLPGEYSEASIGFGFFGGTWMPTAGMNSQNKEDPGKYTDMRACSFLVDTQYPERIAAGQALPPSEPDYVADEANWEVVKCLPFMDAASTGFLGRALWVPDLNIVPERFRRKWGRHCLLQRKR